jgi:hypothetical protein
MLIFNKTLYNIFAKRKTQMTEKQPFTRKPSVVAEGFLSFI